MIAGKVTELLEAVIPLTVIGRGEFRAEIEAVIDTGFNGFLTLESSVAEALHLPSAGSRRATLADGGMVAVDAYLAAVVWEQGEREILVIGTSGGALAGMSLLHGSRIVLDVVAGGDVLVAPSC